MTHGTAKVFKSGSGIAMHLSKYACMAEGIKPGSVIEYNIRVLPPEPVESPVKDK